MYKLQMHESAELYDLNCFIPKETARLGLVKYFENSQNAEKSRNGKVLDVACGQGAVTEILCSFLTERATVDSIDISQEVLEYARKHYSALNVNFIMRNAFSEVPEDLKNSYDFVFCNFLFHWLPEHRTLLKNFWDNLKVDGEFLICFYSHFYLWTAYQELASRSTWSKYMKDYKNFTCPYHNDENAEVNFKQVIQECGFSSVRTEVRTVIFNTTEDFQARKEILKSVDPFVPRIPVDKQELYLDELTDILVKYGVYCDYNPLQYDGGPIKVTAKIMIAIATK